MINLLIDEAYAFDFISILDVKKTNSVKDTIIFNNTCDDVRSQVGELIFNEIIKSKIYTKLVEVNHHIYNMIDLIRQQTVQLDAKVIDDANIERYKLKRELQHKFFMSDLSEMKTRI